MEKQITHKVVLNHSKKSITIKCYDKGKKYATYRQDDCPKSLIAWAEDWSESDVINYLRTSESYYFVK